MERKDCEVPSPRSGQVLPGTFVTAHSDSSCAQGPAGTAGDTLLWLKHSLPLTDSQAWQREVEAQTKATVDQLRAQSSCLHPDLGRSILLICEEKHLFLFLFRLSCLAQAPELLPAECNT